MREEPSLDSESMIIIAFPNAGDEEYVHPMTFPERHDGDAVVNRQLLCYG